MKERLSMRKTSGASSWLTMRAWFEQHRFVVLLSSMLLFLSSSATLSELGLSWMMELLLFLTLTILVLGSFTHRIRIVTEMLIALSLLGWIISRLPSFEGILGLSRLGQSLAFALGSIACFRTVFGSGKVDSERICASLSLYLLFGVVFSLLFATVEQIWPGSFSIPEPTVAATEGRPRLNFVYFSYVTLSTVGYGDIVPVSGPAKTLAITEAILGQMYLVVVVAKLVGLHEKES